MRSLNALQAAVLVAIAASVLAVSIPAFLRNLRASHFVEPMEGLQRIAGRATLLAAGRGADTAYPPSVGLTPSEVPRGERVTDPPGTWDHPTWRRLAFEISVPHAFSFQFTSQNARPRELPPDDSAEVTSDGAVRAGEPGSIAEVAAPPASSAVGGGSVHAADSPSAAAAEVLGPAEPGLARFTARAHGDLDGDGNLSTFQISGESRDGAEPLIHSLIVHREIE